MMCPSAWSSGITGQPDHDSQKEQPQQQQATQQQQQQQQPSFSQQPMHYLQQQALAASRLLQQQSRLNSNTAEKQEPDQSQQQTKTEQAQQQYQTPAQQLHQLQHHGFQPQYQHHYPAHPHFLYHHHAQYQPYTMQQQQQPHPGKQQMYVPYGAHYSAMHEPTSCPPMAAQQAAQQSQDNGAPEMAVCSDVKAPALSNTLFSVLQKELQDYVVDEKEISIAGENDKNDGRLRERQETKYSNLLCSLVYFTATDRDGTVHAARGAQVLKRALNSHKLRHFVKTIVPKVDRVQAATKLFDNMKEVLSKISKNTTNAARQLRTTMLACIVSCDLDNKEKKMLSRCLLDEGATKMQKARIHKQLKEASKRRADFFQGQRDFIWESGRAKRKDALSDDVITAVQDAIRTLTAVPPAAGGVAKKGRTEATATASSPAAEDSNPAEGALPTCEDDSGEESDSTTGSRSSTGSGSSASSGASHSSVQECTDAELHRKVLQYLNDERNSQGSSKKPFSISIDRFRIIKRGMGSVKRFDMKRLNNRKRKAASS